MAAAPGLVVLVCCDNEQCPNYDLGPWRVLDDPGNYLPRGGRSNPWLCARCGDALTVVPTLYQPTAS